MIYVLYNQYKRLNTLWFIISSFALISHNSEFLWGALAGGFGEGMMHPLDTVKTRIQSQAILTHSQVTF
ncbi:hypothetical protein L2E82_50950 [Cichorium intybus]|nr:hypothetical protein L2E82_50950 [Cichorium intybus]